MNLIKPQKLNKGDKIATVSPCLGIAGNSDIIWKYYIGKKRLEDLGLEVIPAPNSMKGEEYLKNNPQARAEDLIWAFENEDIKAIIANIGGNDSDKVLPFLDANTIRNNPKIIIGYSDMMNLQCNNSIGDGYSYAFMSDAFLCRNAGRRANTEFL
jgi:muramoyltetrapeptide carboxypeptidase LdcA involved in peptidoglycan recycling